MKKILASLFLVSSFTQAHSQFSIRVSDTNANAVDILYNAGLAVNGDSALGPRTSQFFEFALQIPLPQGDSVTATWHPGAPMASLDVWVHYTAVDFGNKTFIWASQDPSVNYDASVKYNFPASEVVLGTVLFSNGTGSALGALVNAIDYQNQPRYGGNTDGAIWTYQVDVGQDVTDYGNLFYQSNATASSLGSLAPSTTSDSGVTNQKLTLQQPLPIKLLAFDARKDNKNAKIDWSATEKEEQNGTYKLYRSLDGINFDQIATVSAKNQAQALYTYYDMDIAQYGVNTIYYQLGVNETSGNETKSEIKKVQLGTTDMSIALYPNPVKNNATLELSGLKDKKAWVKVVDVTGKTIMNNEFSVNREVENVPLNFSAYAAGVYFITVTSDNYEGSIQFVKQ